MLSIVARVALFEIITAPRLCLSAGRGVRPFRCRFLGTCESVSYDSYC